MKKLKNDMVRVPQYVRWSREVLRWPTDPRADTSAVHHGTDTSRFTLSALI